MSQMNDDNLLPDEPWLTQAKQELSKPLAPSVAGQLRAARRTALSDSTLQLPSFVKEILQWGMPALAGVIAIVLGFNLLSPPSPSSHPPVVAGIPDTVEPLQTAGNMTSEDLSIINAPDDLEFYQNLEFLLWMEQAGNGSQS